MTIWSGRGSTKRYQVKVKGMRLEGLRNEVKDGSMAVEMKWEGPQKSGLSSLYRRTQHLALRKDIKLIMFGQKQLIEGDHHHGGEEIDDFVNVCSFSIVSKDPYMFAPWIVSFHFLDGDSESSSSSSRTKMQVIGKVELNLGELASKMEAQIEQKVPVALQVNGVAMEATFRVVFCFAEMGNNSHSRTVSHDSLGVSPSDSGALLRRAMSHGPSSAPEKARKNKIRLFGKNSSFRKLYEPSTTRNSESNYVVVASSSGQNTGSNSVTELGSSSSSETQLDLVKKGGFWKWKRRRSKKNMVSPDPRPEEPEKKDHSVSWEPRELLSRDGKTRLKADVFFASYDQRGEEAAGESACAVIVAVIAHWLQINPRAMPIGPSELDRLIIEGSTEWRKLCEEGSHMELFPDCHFDLETILRAGLRPLAVLPGGSRIGFFHPEAFDHLRGALSFDDIWDEINKDMKDREPSVYIVRWNDHFFVLKVEENANYIIDSLGERLYEGCDRAYILRFDDSTVMYSTSEENGGQEEDKKDEASKGEVIYKGKECCREYMKRFQAAIPLRELKEEEEKGRTVDVFALYHRLQIDFHLSTPSSTASSSVTTSPDTSHV